MSNLPGQIGTSTDPIPPRLAALKKMPVSELKDEWRSLFGSEPPTFNRRYIESRLSYKLQELAYGGLKPDTVRRLEQMGEELDGGDVVKRRVRQDRRPIAGTRLVREWRGVVHTVTVLADGSNGRVGPIARSPPSPALSPARGGTVWFSSA